ncbi:MAG TPA: F0F1 ATP synthase subunit delta [Candidatus Paceibacterota bacterium]|nr:F0F1 ATP synthase subunit delta [Candidatus Paceibacterota bacterium]
MKYPTHTYAKALAEVIIASKKQGEKDSDKIVKNFLELVRRNGDEVHLHKILEEAGRFARGAGGIRKVSIESARPLNAAQEKEIAKFLTADDIVERTIDPALIAGIRLVVNDEMQFDGSLRGKLDNVFKNI